MPFAAAGAGRSQLKPSVRIRREVRVRTASASRRPGYGRA